MSPIIAALYILCILALLGLGFFVLAKDPQARLNRTFAGLLLALLGWVATLFAFGLQISPAVLLWIGRLNFASVAVAGPLGYLFVRRVAKDPVRNRSVLWTETATITTLSFTRYVDAHELVAAGQHTTVYGSLFALYVLHVVAYLVAALWAALLPHERAAEVREQLRVIGTGGLLTSVIAVVADIVLPYGFGNFRFIHIGTVSTILFLVAVGWAVFEHHLFNIHLVVRLTFVYGGLVALGLEVYHSMIEFLAKLLPLGSPSEQGFAAAVVTLVVYSFTQDALKAWLERAAGHLTRRDPGARRPPSVTHPRA